VDLHVPMDRQIAYINVVSKVKFISKRMKLNTVYLNFMCCLIRLHHWFITCGTRVCICSLHTVVESECIMLKSLVCSPG
jgi:hypothetical protein